MLPQAYTSQSQGHAGTSEPLAVQLAHGLAFVASSPWARRECSCSLGPRPEIRPSLRSFASCAPLARDPREGDIGAEGAAGRARGGCEGVGPSWCRLCCDDGMAREEWSGEDRVTKEAAKLGCLACVNDNFKRENERASELLTVAMLLQSLQSLQVQRMIEAV